MTIDLHQSSFYPLSIYIDYGQVNYSYLREVNWCMLFANIIVVVDESKDDVNAKSEEGGGFTIQRS